MAAGQLRAAAALLSRQDRAAGSGMDGEEVPDQETARVPETGTHGQDAQVA